MLRAIHFLALSLKLWRFAEQEAKALDTLVKLARSAEQHARKYVPRDLCWKTIAICLALIALSTSAFACASRSAFCVWM